MPISLPYRNSHVDRPMQNVMIAYLQNPANAMSSRIFASVPVDKASDIYFKYPKGSWFRNTMQKRAPGTEPKRAGFGVAQETYFCQEWSLATDIPDELRGNFDNNPLQLDRDTTQYLAQQALLNQEIEFAAAYLAVTKWSVDRQGVAAGPTGNQFIRWNEAASDPILDVRKWKREMLERTGLEPQVLALGRQVWDILQDHPDIIERVKYTGTPGAPAVVTRQTLAALFELEEIVVSGISQNTAIDGATDALSFVVGKTGLLAYRQNSASTTLPSAGYVFRWRNFSQAANAQGVEVRRVREDLKKNDVLAAGASYDMKITATDLADFLYDMVA